MSEEIEYPSKERERAKVNVKVSAEVNTYLHDLYNQIQYEFCEQYEDEIKDLQQKVEQLEKELQTTANNCKQLENIRKEENFTGTKGYYKGKEIWCMEYSDEEDKYKNSLRFLKDTLDQLLEENNNGK